MAVDCNGADLGPAEVAAGAAIAAAQGARVLLFGPAARARRAARRRRDRRRAGLDRQGRGPGDAPCARRREASIVQAARAVAEGRAQALVCAGGTGAALAAGIFNIKRARGIYRPALALPLPVPGSPVTLLDVGANAEARREHLVQFAFMGAALAQVVLGVERPRVGLLSNGEEAARGSALVVEAGAELRERAAEASAFEFVGNVEGGDLVSGARRRDRHRRLHRQRRAEGDRGRLADDCCARSATRRCPRRAASSAGCCCAGALGGLREEIDPEGAGRRLPARAAAPRRRAARALHARRLRPGDPARAARRARGHRRRRPHAARSRRRGRAWRSCTGVRAPTLACAPMTHCSRRRARCSR